MTLKSQWKIILLSGTLSAVIASVIVLAWTSMGSLWTSSDVSYKTIRHAAAKRYDEAKSSAQWQERADSWQGARISWQGTVKRTTGQSVWAQQPLIVVEMPNPPLDDKPYVAGSVLLIINDGSTVGYHKGDKIAFTGHIRRVERDIGTFHVVVESTDVSPA